jgi:hypothetical protein
MRFAQGLTAIGFAILVLAAFDVGRVSALDAAHPGMVIQAASATDTVVRSDGPGPYVMAKYKGERRRHHGRRWHRGRHGWGPWGFGWYPYRGYGKWYHRYYQDCWWDGWEWNCGRF